MSETYDVLSSSIAIPADESGDNYHVNGRFAEPGDTYEGMAGVEREWTEDALRSAAEELVGKPITKPVDSFEPHPGVRKTDDGGLEVAPNVPPQSIIGEVTDAKYDDALGLVWQGELTDDEMAEQVENGHVEVSPVVNLDTESSDDGIETIRDTKAIRDLTTVSSGALPGNSIEPGTAEAMAQAFDEGAESSEGTQDDDDPNAGTGDGEGPSTGATAFDSIMDDISDTEAELVAASRQLDDPTVIESADAERLEQADALLSEAEDKDDPTVVDESDYDALQGRVETVREVLEDALIERSELKESTVKALDFDALCGEFEDEDGEFQADALVQEPETETTEDDPDDTNEEELDALKAKAEAFKNTRVGNRLEDKIAELEG